MSQTVLVAIGLRLFRKPRLEEKLVLTTKVSKARKNKTNTKFMSAISFFCFEDNLSLLAIFITTRVLRNGGMMEKD